ncbi:MAG: hypothetical protein D6722_16635 [Bacteroidetes bacterium]|nr:MAG: hypothetical protein D6722_16635 [Bacteroidota bacterium]
MKKLMGWSSLLWLLAACIGTDYVDVPLGTDRSALVVSPRSLSLMVGEAEALSASYRNFDGEEEGVPLSWRAGGEAVATVTSEGLVTAISAGQTHVWVETVDGKRDSCLVTVVADVNAVASVEISGNSDTLGVGEMRTLTATVRNRQGDILPAPMVMWQSSDSSVVSVDEMGVIKGRSAGLAMVTATAGGVVSLPWTVRVGGGSRSGTFSGASGYSVSGEVSLQPQGSGYELVLSDDFMAQPGPGLYVYLAPQGSSGSGGAEIAALQANSGAQTYAIPGSVDPAGFSHVLIYCKPFGVVFGAAELE